MNNIFKKIDWMVLGSTIYVYMVVGHTLFLMAGTLFINTSVWEHYLANLSTSLKDPVQYFWLFVVLLVIYVILLAIKMSFGKKTLIVACILLTLPIFWALNYANVI